LDLTQSDICEENLVIITFVQNTNIDGLGLYHTLTVLQKMWRMQSRKNMNSSEGEDSHERLVMAEFRSAIWQSGALGFFTGVCFGILAAPYSKRFLGVHSNVAMPLGCASLFSMFGSAIAANKHSPDLQYSMFKRRETLRAQLQQHQHQQRLAKANKDEDKYI
jgi:hypothetical protein